MEIDHFIECVPVGSQNGIKIEYLAARTGMSSRAARSIIEQINASGKALIINLSDSKGYFIAGENEKHLERLYKAQEAKRFLSLKDKLEGMNTYLAGKKENEVDENQISLFDYGIKQADCR